MTDPQPTAWQSWCAARPGRRIPDYDPDATAAEGEWFDSAFADKVIKFISLSCVHIEGALADKPMILEPWQEAIVGALFGWKRCDGKRRYREAFIEVARKNGKTTLCAAIIIVGMLLDKEPGAQVYSAAGDRDQAAIVFSMVASMIERNEELSKLLTVHRGAHRIFLNTDRQTFYKAVSSESATKHGYNAHIVIMDELHTQPSRDLYDVLRTSQKARRQPLMISITTADFHRESICNDREQLAEQVCDGTLEMPQFLPVLYRLKPEDDWHDEANWRRANPNLGVSIDPADFRESYLEACASPSFENTFKRLHLCIKTETANRWLSMEDWGACGGKFPESLLEGQRCWCGLDLASTTDIAAFAMAFPGATDEEPVHAIMRFWIPKEKAVERERRDGVPYLAWHRQGFLSMTPGDVIDYAYIKKEICELGKRFNIREIGYDRWNAAETVQSLQDEYGFAMVEIPQTMTVMNDPTKQLEAIIIKHQLRHGENPVLRWMAQNCIVKSNSTGLIRIDKEKSSEKVDGMVALAMAIGRMGLGRSKVVSRSYLEDSELILV